MLDVFEGWSLLLLLGISKLQFFIKTFFICIFSLFFCHQNPGSGLDPDPYPDSMNHYPQFCVPYSNNMYRDILTSMISFMVLWTLSRLSNQGEQEARTHLWAGNSRPCTFRMTSQKRPCSRCKRSFSKMPTQCVSASAMVQGVGSKSLCEKRLVAIPATEGTASLSREEYYIKKAGIPTVFLSTKMRQCLESISIVYMLPAAGVHSRQTQFDSTYIWASCKDDILKQGLLS